MANGEIVKHGARDANEHAAGAELEVITGRNGENYGGRHPLDVITAVIGLTRRVQESSTKEIIEIAGNMGLETIDELERLVDVSERVQVLDSPNGHPMPEATPEEVGETAVRGDEATEPGSGEHEEPIAVPGSDGGDATSTEKVEQSSVNGERYSETFDNLPKYRPRNGQPTKAMVFNDAIIEFMDRIYARGESTDILPTTKDKGSALSALVRILREDPECGYDLEGLDAATRYNVFDRLVACGYLQADIDTGDRGGRSYRRIVAVRLGTPNDSVKKN